MQLKLYCVYVLVHVSFVRASPHGYGIKGGAAAKAQAGAIAGAFGGVGEIPTGSLPEGDFSGSFSKSSSSSFASSSASSSSSAFTLSGSSSSGNNGGCSSGTCGTSNDVNHNGNTFANNQNRGYNGNSNSYQNGAATGAVAQAGAAAQASAIGISKSPSCIGINCSPKTEECKGYNCNGAIPSYNNCASGQCGTDSESKPVYDSYNADENNRNKCQSGQCEPSSHTKPCAGGVCTSNTPSVYNHNSNANSDASTATGTTSGSYYSSPNKCASGQCKPPQPDTSITNPGPEDIHVDIDKTFKSKSPNYQTLSPKSNECTNGNCANNPNLNSNPTYPYSSQNIPLPSNNDASKCNSPNCKGDTDTYNQCSSPDCASPQNPPHQSYPTQSGNSIVGSSYNPSPNFPSSTVFTNTHTPFPSGPNQFPNPTHGDKTSKPADFPAFVPLVPSSPIQGVPNKPSKNNEKPYIGGFGGPPGILKPNEFNKPNLPVPGFGGPPAFAKPNEPNTPNHPVNNHKPNFGGPPGILNPNDFNKPNLPVGSHKPFNSAPCVTGNCNQGQNVNSLTSGTITSIPCTTGNCGPHNIDNNTPSSKPCLNGNCNYDQNGYKNPSGFPSVESCVTGNCGPQKVSGLPGYNPAPQHGNGGVTNGIPAIQAAVPCSSGNCNYQNSGNSNLQGAYNNVPCTTGNCGSQTQGSNSLPCVSGNCHKLTEPHHGTPCATGNCGSQKINSVTSSTNGAHASAAAAAAATASVYTGGFGGPPGFLKPYDNGKIESSHGQLTGKHTGLQSSFNVNPPGGHTAFNVAGSNAGAFAAAGATAGAFGGVTNPSGHYRENEEHKGGACGNGCAGSGSNDHNNGQYTFGLSGGLSAAKAGSASGSDAGSFNFGRSFASSAAVAHASSGAAVKGYGRR